MIHSLAGGGAERLMAGLASRLVDRHQVTLLTLDDGTGDRYPLDPRVARRALSMMADSRHVGAAIRNNRRRVARLRQAIDDSRPDVVLSFCDKNNVLTLIACAPLGVPVVVSEHTDPRHQRLGPVWSLLRRLYYRRAAASIALTAATADYLCRWTAGAPAVIPPAVDSALSRRQVSAAAPQGPDTPAAGALPKPVPANSGRFHWLAVGRLSPEKAFDRGIRAFAELAPEFPQWSLVIAGEGPERERLQRQIDDLGIADRVELTGWVDDVAALLAAGDAFVLTSLYEGFPVSLLEAMAAGLACVAVDCQSGPGEAIRDSENGCLVPQDDAAGLRRAMQRVMSNPDFRQRIGQRARGAAARYDWASFVASHERVLHEAAGRIGSPK